MNKHEQRQVYTALPQTFLLTVLSLSCLLWLNACKDYQPHQVVHPHTPVATLDPRLLNAGLAATSTFQIWISTLHTYHSDTSQYQQEYHSDQQALTSSHTNLAYQSALHTLNQHIASIKLPTLQGEARQLSLQLAQKVNAWEQQHPFYDAYNHQTYHLGYEYGPDGAGGLLTDKIAQAKTLTDYQNAIATAQTTLANLQAYETNQHDTTAWNRPHQTDLQLLLRNRVIQTRAIVVSLNEQTLRVYDHSTLIRSLLITSGRPERPSLPGLWTITARLAPTLFKSVEAHGSLYWYPPTPINYALLYHSGGYFIHDSWWRVDYGPHTQFPHRDSSGDSFSFDGSHGCINLATTSAAWLYHSTTLNTPVLIY